MVCFHSSFEVLASFDYGFDEELGSFHWEFDLSDWDPFDSVFAPYDLVFTQRCWVCFPYRLIFAGPYSVLVADFVDSSLAEDHVED